MLDNKLDDYGAAYPGFLILNPKLLARVSMPVKLWIHAHECGHQFRGPDEETADCFAVQRGRRQGWLTPEGLEEVCKFISPAKGDSMHFSGSQPLRGHAQVLRRSDQIASKPYWAAAIPAPCALPNMWHLRPLGETIFGQRLSPLHATPR